MKLRPASPFRRAESVRAGNVAARIGTYLGTVWSALRGLEAGGGGPRWLPGAVARNVPAFIRAGAETAGARGAYHYLNDSHANNIVETWCASALGERGPQPASQHPDTATARALARAFARFAAAAGVNGEHLADILRLLLASTIVSGDGFLALSTDEDGRLRLAVLAPDQIDRSKTMELGGGARIVEGIQFDAAGRVEGYWLFADPQGMPFVTALASTFVPASEILHLFRPLAPGQVRGLSMLAPVLTTIAEHHATHDAMAMQQKIAALFCGVWQDPNGAGDMAEPGAGGGPPQLTLEPGAVLIGPPGREFVPTNPPQSGEGVAFLKSMKQAIAAGVGLPYPLLSGDFSDTNYSSLRGGMTQHYRRVGALRKQTIEPRVLDPIWRRFVELEVLSGRIDAPDFESSAEDFNDCEWVWPAFPALDPVKEADGEISLIAAGLKSRRESIAASGRDADAVMEAVAAEPPLPPPAAKPVQQVQEEN